MMKFISLARKAQAAELPPPSLADEATSMVGLHDALRAQGLEELRAVRGRLALNIEFETAALAEVDAVIEREEAVDARMPDFPKRTSELAAAE